MRSSTPQGLEPRDFGWGLRSGCPSYIDFGSIEGLVGGWQKAQRHEAPSDLREHCPPSSPPSCMIRPRGEKVLGGLSWKDGAWPLEAECVGAATSPTLGLLKTRPVLGSIVSKFKRGRGGGELSF